MNKQLMRYDKARNALAGAASVADVTDALDQGVALKVYARQAKDDQLVIDAVDLVMRALRRLGEVIAEKRDTGELPEGRPKKRIDGQPVIETLEKQGVDKYLRTARPAKPGYLKTQFLSKPQGGARGSMTDLRRSQPSRSMGMIGRLR